MGPKCLNGSKSGPEKVRIQQKTLNFAIIWDPSKPGVRSLGPNVCLSVSPPPCWDLTDVTLADGDTNSIPSDNANANYDGPICNWCKWLLLAAKFASVQVAPPGGQNSTCKWQVAPSCGQICDQFKQCQVMVLFRSDQSGATCHLRD